MVNLVVRFYLKKLTSDSLKLYFRIYIILTQVAYRERKEGEFHKNL